MHRNIMADKISVLMPCYNAEEFIDEAVASIVSQSYYNWELIIHDDNSTDNSFQKAIAWQSRDPRVKVSRNYGQHGHFIDICNDQISESSGYYIARLDADDIATENRLQRQAGLYDEYRAKHVAALGALAIEITRADNNTWGRNPYGWIDEYIVPVASYDTPVNQYLSTFNRVIHSTLFTTRENIVNVGGYDAIDPVEDYDLSLKLSETGNIYVIPEVLATKRRHENNYSKLTKQRLGDSLAQLASRHQFSP